MITLPHWLNGALWCIAAAEAAMLFVFLVGG